MNKWRVCLIALCGLAVQAHAQAQQGPPPAPQAPPKPVCSRESLQTAVDSYLAAQKAGDSRKMAFAGKVKYLENMAEVAADKGLWNTALPIGFSRSILD